MRRFWLPVLLGLIYIVGSLAQSPSDGTLSTVKAVSTSGEGLSVCEQLAIIEGNALLNLYSTLGGVAWTNSSGWVDRVQGARCGWVGVSCETQMINETDLCAVVTALQLPENGVVGSLDLSIFRSLRYLQMVNLSTNRLTEVGASLPDPLAIQVLDIFSNPAVRSVFSPNVMSALRNIRLLNISLCDVQGDIPSSIAMWKELEVFNIEVNNMTGSIPQEMGALPQFKEFYAGGNSFSGPLPSWLCNNTMLRALLLKENQFSGGIPSELGKCTSLELFDVSSNSLTGEIPIELRQMANLRIFAVAVNALEGNFTHDLFLGWKKLQSLVVFRDSISGRGELAYFAQLPYLKALIVAGNDFHGTIPTELCELEYLESLNLLEANLYGTIPTCFGKLQRLQQFLVSNNNLTGTIPSELGAARELNVISIALNSLEGTVPTELNELSLLGYDFSNNRLHGPLPRIKGSVFVLLQDNNFTSSIIEMMHWIQDVRPVEVQMQRNNIYGSFPSGLPAVTEQAVENLFLFEGPLNTVMQLDLAENPITGSIPQDLFLLHFDGLQRLNLSHTQIEGEMPFTYLDISALLLLDLTGVRLKPYSGPLISFVPDTSVFVEQGASASGANKTFTCELVRYGVSPVQVIGVGPEFYGYEHCSCIHGFVGSPPHCKPAPNRAVEIAVPLIVVVFLGIVVGVIAFRKYRQRYLKRTADRLLADYPSGMEMSSVGGTTSGSDGTLSGQATSNSSGGTASAGGPRKDSSCITVTPDLQRFIIPYKDISILRPIAHGASGCVHLGLWRQTQVAVKVFYPSVDMDQCDFCTESAVHAQLRHPNIVLLLGVCMEPLATVQEFMPRGALYALLRSRSNRETLRKHSFQIAVDMCRGLAYLHSCNILHRDVKSLNVLIDNGWTAKVTDFGSSRHMSNSTMTAGIGTVAWMAPETFESGKYTAACDVYSVGMVLWELVSGGAMPFETVGFTFEVAQLVQSGERPTIPPMCRSEYRSIIEQCWNGDASQRPSMAEVVDMLEAIPGHPALVPPEMSLTGER